MLNKFVIGQPYIEITSTCNLKCTYCYNDSGINKVTHMNIDMFRGILDEVVENSVKKIVISGGEPFMHPQINDFLELTFSKKLLPIIITNATIVTRENMEVIRKQPCIIQLTFDDYNEENHDLYRGKDTFYKNICLIQQLKKDPEFIGKIHIRVHLRKSTINRAHQMIQYFNNLPIDILSFATIKDMGRANQKDFKDIDTTAIINMSKHIERHITEYIRKPIMGGVVCGLQERCPYVLKEGITFSPRIASNGSVYPCQLCVDDLFLLGNMQYQSLIDIAYGLKMSNFLGLVQERIYKLENCKSCKIKQWCGRGCLAKTWLEYKDIFMTDGSCQIKKFHYKEYLRSCATSYRQSPNAN